MLTKYRLFVFVRGVLLVALAGCAGYKVLPVDSKNDAQEGLRFYRPQPYLVVREDTTGKKAGTERRLAYEVIYLPDYSKGYVMQRRGGLGTVEASVKLTNGWMLAELGMKTDSQVPQTIEAIAKIIPAVLGVPLAKNQTADTLTPGLYQIRLDSLDGVYLKRVDLWSTK